MQTGYLASLNTFKVVVSFFFFTFKQPKCSVPLLMTDATIEKKNTLMNQYQSHIPLKTNY